MNSSFRAIAAALVLTLPYGIAAGAATRGGAALVIGNADYRGSTPDAPYALRDARMVRRHVLGRLGYAADKVILLEDAGLERLREALRDLAAATVVADQTPLIVFYSGHCAPGPTDGRGYLLPVDADPHRLAETALPMSELYQTLLAARPRHLIVILECGFVGDSFGGPLLTDPAVALEETVLPPPDPRIVLLAATGTGEIANWDVEAGMGLFTRYLLLALDGAADTGRLGNGDGRVSIAELQVWLEEEVGFTAKRRFGRTQHPLLMGPPDAVLGLASSGGWPEQLSLAETRAMADALMRGALPDPAPPEGLPSRTVEDRGPPPVEDRLERSGADAVAPASEPAREAAAETPASAPEPSVESLAAADPASGLPTPAEAEAALALSAEQRREVQRALRRIGHDIGAVDGDLGPISRRAIASWQRSTQRSPTGYLTADQLEVLLRRE
jgi:hypothetical protein